MIYQDPETNLYSLGNKLSVLGSVADKQNGLLTTINNALCQLRDKLNISTGLAIQKGDGLSLIRYNRSNKNIERYHEKFIYINGVELLDFSCVERLGCTRAGPSYTMTSLFGYVYSPVSGSNTLSPVPGRNTWIVAPARYFPSVGAILSCHAELK